jgi:hypothetical protein
VAAGTHTLKTPAACTEGRMKTACETYVGHAEHCAILLITASIVARLCASFRNSSSLHVPDDVSCRPHARTRQNNEPEIGQ